MEKADPPAEESAGSTHINIKVKAQDGSEVFFKIKRSTNLKKLMEAYCSRQGVSSISLVFTWS